MKKLIAIECASEEDRIISNEMKLLIYALCTYYVLNTLIINYNILKVLISDFSYISM